MSDELSARIKQHFAGLTDPRRRKVTYPLINIVTIALCAVIAGADDFVTIAAWGRQKRAWLARFLDMAGGIPSHDRFNAVFKAIKPAEFERCLLSWITSLHEVTAGQLVAIDGKTLRQSFDKADAKSAIHMISAWATANHISLGQVVVDEKSNEIMAIPKLLDLLDVSGCLVTIDAMGCQAEIAEKIVEGKADYVLAVKGNQPTLYDGVVEFFLDHMEDEFARVKVSRHEMQEHGHGRDERRTYLVCDVPEGLPDRGRWRGLKRIGVAISETVRGGKACDDVRYYILSKKLSARSFGAAVRGHWSIEIPRPDDPRRNNLCAVGRADYHCHRRPVGIGRVEQQKPSGPRRQLMLNNESICVPPPPTVPPPDPLTAIWTQLPPDRRRRLQRLLAELLARPLDTDAAAPREGNHDHPLA